MSSTIEPGAGRQRVVYLDWLRIMAVLLLIPFHVTRLFDVFEPFYVKNAELSFPLSVIIGLVAPWHMPLLFLLAGAATWFALGFRSSGTYALERFKRLLIPFVFGVLVLVPPQMYYALRHHARLTDSYLQYYPNFFQAPVGPDYYGVGLSFAHLWFILFLFAMSLVALPLFVWLRTSFGQRMIARLADVSSKPGVLFLMIIPLIVGDTLPSILGKEAFLYLFLFICGFVLAANAGFQEAIDRNKGLGLVLGVVSMASFFALLLFTEARPGGEGWLGDLFDLCVLISMWSWLVALLGYGRKHLGRANGALAYLNEMVYPFYILHQTVIVVIGFYVVQWDMNVYAKFIVILVASFAGTIAIYDLVVRRVNVLRFLFGMKPKSRTSARFARDHARGRLTGEQGEEPAAHRVRPRLAPERIAFLEDAVDVDPVEPAALAGDQDLHRRPFAVAAGPRLRHEAAGAGVRARRARLDENHVADDGMVHDGDSFAQKDAGSGQF